MTVTIQEPKQTTLYYREGSSDKVYRASLEGTDNTDLFHVRFAYGRRGATLQTGTKTPAPVSYATALKTFNQLVAAKLAKGYTPGEDGTPYQHTGNEGRSTGIYPQLLNSVEDEHALGSLLLDPMYCLQEKHDGFRMMLRKRGNIIEGINRKGLLIAIPAAIENAMQQVREDFLLDGEAIGDDITEKYLLLTNSHDGTSALQVKFTPVRVVCQNTLTMALGSGQSGIKISHHTDIHQRMKAAEKMLGIVHHQFDELADTFREMVKVPMTHNRLERYLEFVYPDPKDRVPTESELECITRDRSWSEYFFDQGAGNRLNGVGGTLWAAYNGVTEWVDHRKIRQNPDQRLASIWFGEANRVKARALSVATEMLPHFRN